MNSHEHQISSVKQKSYITCANHSEYQKMKKILENDTIFSSTRKLIQSFDDEKKTITYLTEEISPDYKKEDRIKVLLLFKNPHPDSVAAGLFLSEPHSQTFWNRLFEADYNRNLLPLLKQQTGWIKNLADTLLTGKYDSPFLYYFRCLYPFPTKQFADLQLLFAGAPLTYQREIRDKSAIELNDYLKQYARLRQP